MNCEKCNITHDGSYGSGRFCGVKCSRKTRLGMKNSNKIQPPASKERKTKLSQTAQQKQKDLPWHQKNKFLRFTIVMEEQDNKCLICGMLPIWNNMPIRFHLDHINGIHSDNRRENVRAICPNCHTQTPTYGFKKRFEP